LSYHSPPNRQSLGIEVRTRTGDAQAAVPRRKTFKKTVGTTTHPACTTTNRQALKSKREQRTGEKMLSGAQKSRYSGAETMFKPQNSFFPSKSQNFGAFLLTALKTQNFRSPSASAFHLFFIHTQIFRTHGWQYVFPSGCAFFRLITPTRIVQ